MSSEQLEATPQSSTRPKFWLLKAEPDSRIVKGKDVKFSVADFEQVGTSPWEGVRNYEARNLMREMRVGDKALFYHSNCKTPGVAAFAKVAKEAYPDYTAWDASHPYYDPKSDSTSPKWYMVDLQFVSRAKHFVPLALLRHVAGLKDDEPPPEIAYIRSTGVQAIKNMNLVTRGRLSVQRVSQEAWDVVCMLAQQGGWEEGQGIASKTSGKTKVKEVVSRKKVNNRKVENTEGESNEGENENNEVAEKKRVAKAKPKGRPLVVGKKRKDSNSDGASGHEEEFKDEDEYEDEDEDETPPRSSTKRRRKNDGQGDSDDFVDDEEGLPLRRSTRTRARK